MRRRLVHRLVPAGVGVRRAHHHAIGAFERRHPRARTATGVTVRRNTRRSCQSSVGLDIEARAVGGQHIGLRDGRGAIFAHHADGGAMRAALDELDALERGELLAALGVVVLDVPGVPVARLVDRIGPELVAAARPAPRGRSACGSAMEIVPSAADRRLQNGVLQQRLAWRSGRRPARCRRPITATPSGGTVPAPATTSTVGQRQVEPARRSATGLTTPAAHRPAPLGSCAAMRRPAPSACAALPASMAPPSSRSASW